MHLKIRRSPEGLPQIEIHFEEGDGEPMMVLEAMGFDTDEELAGTLADIAVSIHESLAHVVETEYYGRHNGLTKPDERSADELLGNTPRHKPFNPRPRGPRTN